MKKYFGIKDIEFVDHGEWSDAELRYLRRRFNESVVTNSLYETWKGFEKSGELAEEYLGEGGFDRWVADNPEEVYSQLMELEFCAYDYVEDNVTLTEEQRKWFDKLKDALWHFENAGGELVLMDNDVIAYNGKNTSPIFSYWEEDERSWVLDKEFFSDRNQTLIEDFAESPWYEQKALFEVKQ